MLTTPCRRTPGHRGGGRLGTREGGMGNDPWAGPRHTDHLLREEHPCQNQLSTSDKEQPRTTPRFLHPLPVRTAISLALLEGKQWGPGILRIRRSASLQRPPAAVELSLIHI